MLVLVIVFVPFFKQIEHEHEHEHDYDAHRFAIDARARIIPRDG